MKRRRRSLPLFQAFEPDTYVIDTSAWLNITARSDAEDVWRTVVDLIQQGRVVACATVIQELRNDPIYAAHIKPYEKELRAGDRGTDDIEYLQLVGRITYEFPSMSKATSRKTPADPYVVALGKIDRYVVVADETCTRRPRRKIPGACKELGVRCLTLSEFVKESKAKP